MRCKLYAFYLKNSIRKSANVSAFYTVAIDFLRRCFSAIKSPVFCLASLNFSPNMPDFDCKICLLSQKTRDFLTQKTPSQQV